MRPGFMTSVCPQQTVPELVATAIRHGYQGIEFRVEWKQAHGIELSASVEDIHGARRALVESGLAATCLATSVRFNTTDPAEHRAQREILRRYIELAAELGAPCIRTFSDRLPEVPEVRDQVLDMAAESYAAVDAFARQHRVQVLVETHTNLLAQYAARILERADARSLGVLWHPGHHLQRGQSIDQAYAYLRGHVWHVHWNALSGSPAREADHRRMFQLLAGEGYAGYFSVEVINPEDPEAVLKHHMERYRQYMAAPWNAANSRA